jgi:hypothetical protein
MKMFLSPVRDAISVENYFNPSRVPLGTKYIASLTGLRNSSIYYSTHITSLTGLLSAVTHAALFMSLSLRQIFPAFCVLVVKK